MAARGENVLFLPENLDIWGQKSINSFPIRTTPKKISVSKLLVILRGSPLFLAVSGFCHFSIKNTLNFGTVRAFKKMTHGDNRPGTGRNCGEKAVLTFDRKVFFWPKMYFPPKKTQKFAKRLICILEKGTLFFAQLFPVEARTWCPARSESFFLGPKSRFLAQKKKTSPICGKSGRHNAV